MKEKKEIQSVRTLSRCAEKYPCRHEILIQYKDGTEKKKQSDGITIANKYGNYLNDSDRKHFSGYVKSGLFGNSNSTSIKKNNSEDAQPDSFSNRI